MQEFDKVPDKPPGGRPSDKDLWKAPSSFRPPGPLSRTCLWAIEPRASVWSAGLPPLSCAPCAPEDPRFIAGKLGDKVVGRFMCYTELDLVKPKRKLTRVPEP